MTKFAGETVRKGSEYGLPYDTRVIPLSPGWEITVIPYRGRSDLFEAILWDDTNYTTVIIEVIGTNELDKFVSEAKTYIHESE